MVHLILKSESGPYLCQAKNSCIMLICILPAFMNESLFSLITWLLHSIYHSRYPSTLPRFLESLPFLRFKFTVLLQLFNYPFSSLLGFFFLPPAPYRFLAPCPSLLVWFSGESSVKAHRTNLIYTCVLCVSQNTANLNFNIRVVHAVLWKSGSSVIISTSISWSTTGKACAPQPATVCWHWAKLQLIIPEWALCTPLSGPCTHRDESCDMTYTIILCSLTCS